MLCIPSLRSTGFTTLAKLNLAWQGQLKDMFKALTLQIALTSFLGFNSNQRLLFNKHRLKDGVDSTTTSGCCLINHALHGSFISHALHGWLINHPTDCSFKNHALHGLFNLTESSSSLYTIHPRVLLRKTHALFCIACRGCRVYDNSSFARVDIVKRAINKVKQNQETSFSKIRQLFCVVLYSNKRIQ